MCHTARPFRCQELIRDLYAGCGVSVSIPASTALEGRRKERERQEKAREAQAREPGGETQGAAARVRCGALAARAAAGHGSRRELSTFYVAARIE